MSGQALSVFSPSKSWFPSSQLVTAVRKTHSNPKPVEELIHRTYQINGIDEQIYDVYDESRELVESWKAALEWMIYRLVHGLTLKSPFRLSKVETFQRL